MKQDWYGDSYDIVKRFFCTTLASLGYVIYVDSSYYINLSAADKDGFYRLIEAKPLKEPISAPSALLLDPDTGLSQDGSPKYITFKDIWDRCNEHDLVFAFDQSFQWRRSNREAIERKLNELVNRQVFGLYYDSHAKFLFAAKENKRANIDTLRKHLIGLGLPKDRLIVLPL